MKERSYAEKLTRYVCRQVDNLFPSDDPFVLDPSHVCTALERTNHCVSKNRTFSGTNFDYLNSGQYASFLYYLSNTLWSANQEIGIPTRIFLLNKALNGIDLYFEVKMPEVFFIAHTVGMVFAKATYGNNCIFHQGCTVGRNREDRPTLEPAVIMFPNSSIIGACRVRENTVLSPGVQLVNTDTPGNCIVFRGEGRNFVFKELNEYYVDRYLVRP